MDQNLKNEGQFRMRMDGAVDDNVIPTQVDELRIEKLSTKVTIISIIIPVLIVVVLAITYIDIKNRVTRSEDTGTTGVENLSKDMESRFSTLSVRQANLEDLIKKMVAQNDKAIARIEVKLKKISDSSKSLKRAMVNKTQLENKTTELQQQIGNVSQAVETGHVQTAELTQALKAQMDQISTNDSQNNAHRVQVDERLNRLDQGKIDKAALDLALKLEILKLKKSYNAQLIDIQERIRRIEKSPAGPSIQSAPAPTSKTLPEKITPQAIPPAPSAGGIIEQNIGK